MYDKLCFIYFSALANFTFYYDCSVFCKKKVNLWLIEHPKIPEIKFSLTHKSVTLNM